MCGICGLVYQDPSRSPDSGMLERMNATLVHRGPDDGGQIIRGKAGLAMRRLSIIDLSTGHQPISDESDRRHIVFNGEIYNFKGLQRELQQLGHRFSTQSDTEVILHGFEEWGTDICRRLNGMFAFAIYDENDQSLFLARDRLGIKPLYYYRDQEKLVFASEIKAILKCDRIDKTIDYDALNNFLTCEYIPAPRSIFSEIKKLEPGHWLSLQGESAVIQAYWELRPGLQPWGEEEAEERLRELMQDSVRMRLISDVPLGTFLSGGIDSSIVVSQMAGIMDRPVKTFSIGFEEDSYNELRYARAVADKYGTEHHEFIIRPQALDLTEKLIGQLDEPFGDFSIFPTYLVAKMARDFVTVALSGDGGDELFAGYDTYRAHLFDRRFYHLLPKMVKRYGFETLANRLNPTEKKKGVVNSFKRFVLGTTLPKSLLQARWMIFLGDTERQRLFTESGRKKIHAEDPYDFLHRWSRLVTDRDEVTATGFLDAKTYLPDNILVKVDRMTMATSLEARVPFLDHRIVEFAFSLPPALKLKRLATKRILKKTFWNDLPLEVQRRGKEGFSIPIKNWLQQELKPMMTDLLSSDRLRRQDIFNGDFVQGLMQEHLSNRENHSHLLWALMVFQKWYDLYA